MRSARLFIVLGGLGSLLLCACAHVAAPSPVSLQGTWEVAALRARLGAGLVELTQAETSAQGQDGQQHRYAASGLLLLALDGRCRLLVDVRVDGATPGRSERACTWRGEGTRLVLADEGGAVTAYRVSPREGGVLLEALANPTELEEERTTGERMMLVPAQTAPALAALPDSDGPEGTR